MPIIIDGYLPEFSKLFDFFANLFKNVQWDDEEKCLGALSFALAEFYALDSSREKTSDLVHVIEHRIFELIRSPFFVSRKDLDVTTTLATLPQLYKIFERC